MSFARFAIYYLPADGALSDFGAAWLGWDVARGAVAHQPDVPGIVDATAAPRKYGFHATLKPPFVLAAPQDAAALARAVADMAASCPPARCDGLRVSSLGRFLALTPQGDAAQIARIAATCVRDLDRFRAPASLEELARRRQSGLSQRQDIMLARWGYPYVMEEFRFHMTLTGRLPKADIPGWEAQVRAHLPALPAPFVMDAVALVGEREDGCFELIQRYALTG